MTVMTTLDELFSQDEAERLAKDKIAQEAELKAWWALPQSERDRICAERDAKWDAIYEASKHHADDEDTDEDEDDDQEDI